MGTMLKRFIMNRIFSLLVILFVLPQSGLATAKSPWQKREILVYNPVWKNASSVPTFIQDKLEKALISPKGSHGWVFKQVGFLPIVLRGEFERSEEDYSFSITISHLSGKIIVSLKSTCDACTTTEAVSSLKDLRSRIIGKLEVLFVAGHKIYLKTSNKTEISEIDKKIQLEKIRQEKIKQDLELMKPQTRYELGKSRKMKIPDYEQTPNPKKMWMWGLTGVSAVSTIAGIYLVAINQNTTCNSANSEECQERYARIVAGYSFITAGLALGGLTAYLYYTVIKAKPEPRVTITPAVSGKTKGVSISFRF
jgi:hypothetical protein